MAFGQTNSWGDQPHPLTSSHELISTISDLPHHFLQPSFALHAASLSVTKNYLDPLASSTSLCQQQRQSAIRKKRKRGKYDGAKVTKPLALKQIYIDGFEIEQIWGQAKRIIDATTIELQRSLASIAQDVNKSISTSELGNHGKAEKESGKFNEPEGDGIGITNTDVLSGSDDEDLRVQHQSARGDVEESVEIEEDLEESRNLEGIDDEEDIMDDLDEEDTDKAPHQNADFGDIFVQDKLGLNDGFFSIDDFNRQAEFQEQQDARNENNEDISSDEEVDWSADPLAAQAPSKTEKDIDDGGDDDQSTEEVDGPTFSTAHHNVQDHFDMETDSEGGVQMEDVGNIQNTNDIKYADFFAPPARRVSKIFHHPPLPKTQPPANENAEVDPAEADMQRTIAAVSRDIFEDNLTASDSAISDPEDRRSSHQKRQAKISEEIRRLEAAAVAKRDWALSGEARAVDRPINSLLEEDLEFERTGKPIPVITQEVSEDIEALIKRRIIAREFDEVIRRRPGVLTNSIGKDVRRGRVELEDDKPQQSLAEIYEKEYLQNADPGNYSDKRSETLKKEHAKIEALWKDVSSKLDALSSLHFRPKPPEPSVNVVADIPTITMEDARPAASSDIGGESMLAPQEIYKAGEARDKRVEVSTKAGQPVGRDEMTREEKVRRRRREKERIRKAGGFVGKQEGERNEGAKQRQKTEEKKGVIGELKKSGVRVIGRKGEIRDVEGNAVRGPGALGKGADGYKL